MDKHKKEVNMEILSENDIQKVVGGAIGEFAHQLVANVTSALPEMVAPYVAPYVPVGFSFIGGVLVCIAFNANILCPITSLAVPLYYFNPMNLPLPF